MMDVLTAFREFAPPTSDPRSVAHAAQCAEALVAAFSTLAVKCKELFPHDLQEQAISDSIFKLYRRGPRGVRAGDPETEDGVRAYLFTMLSNWAISRHRTAKRHRIRETPLDLVVAPSEPADPANPFLLFDRRENEALIEGLATQLFDEIIPVVAAMPPAAPDLVATARQLRVAVRDKVQVDQIARDLLHAVPEPIREVDTAAVRKRGLPLDQHSAAHLAAQGLAWAPGVLASLPLCRDDGACGQYLDRIRAALEDAQVTRLRVNLDARYQRARRRVLNGIKTLCAQGRFDAQRAAQLEMAVHAHLRFYH